MGVAKELGYSLRKLLEEVTEEELLLWSAYFGHLHNEQEKSHEKGQERTPLDCWNVVLAVNRGSVSKRD